ncbi:MAG: hypothetical protein PHO90_00440 [Candidatus Pacebacteria bacterium]|nr:hypothetical protein [Candidatus Paceibacterota bacterium]
MSTEDVNPFEKWRQVKKTYLALQEDLEDKNGNVTIPVNSWTQVAEEACDLIKAASELLSEIPKAQEKIREEIIELYEKKK